MSRHRRFCLATTMPPDYESFERAGGPGGSFEAWAIHVLRVSDGRISGIDFFVDPDLFPLFGLPVRLGDQAGAHR